MEELVPYVFELLLGMKRGVEGWVCVAGNAHGLDITLDSVDLSAFVGSARRSSSAIDQLTSRDQSRLIRLSNSMLIKFNAAVMRWSDG